MPQIEVTADNQRLNQVRFEAFESLSHVRGRSLKAAGLVRRKNAGQIDILYKDQYLASMAPGFTAQDLARELIYSMNEWNTAVLEHVRPILQAGVELPAGYEWKDTYGRINNDQWLESDVSLNVRLAGPANLKADQFRAEFRMFPRECKAHLFLTFGPQINFQAETLLQYKEPYVYADTPADMAHQLVERFNAAMRRFQAAHSAGQALAAGAR